MLTQTQAKNLLSFIAGTSTWSLSETVYLGLLTGFPTDSSGNRIVDPSTSDIAKLEPSTAGYARVEVSGNFNADSTETDDNGNALNFHYNADEDCYVQPNESLIQFPECHDEDTELGDWGGDDGLPLTHFLLATTDTGVPYYIGELTEPMNITDGKVALFRKGELIIKLQGITADENATAID